MSKLNIPEEYIKKYGGQGGCGYYSICDYSYASDICHLKEGYDCPEYPRRKTLRKQMDEDVAKNPNLAKIIAELDEKNKNN